MAMAVRASATCRYRCALRNEAARAAGNLERADPAWAKSGFCRGELHRQLLRDRLRELPGMARLGLSGSRNIQWLRDGRAALLRRCFCFGGDGPAYGERRAGLFPLWNAGPGRP